MVLPSLAYTYDALEPVFSEEALRIHHSKHHQAYVDNFNRIFPEYNEEAKKPEAEQNKDKMKYLDQLLAFHAGGHVNHSFFWETLTPTSKFKEPSQFPIYELISEHWGSYENFQEDLTTAAVSVQGSGWAWLTCSFDKKLGITLSADQDILADRFPLLCIDVWEHSYYLRYKQDRKQYCEDIWQIMDWATIQNRYDQAVEYADSKTKEEGKQEEPKTEEAE